MINEWRKWKISIINPPILNSWPNPSPQFTFSLKLWLDFFSYPWSNTITCTQLLPPFGIMCASVSWHFFIFLSLCHNSHLVTHTWLWRSLGRCTFVFCSCAFVYLWRSQTCCCTGTSLPLCSNTLGCSVHEVAHFVGTLGFPNGSTSIRDIYPVRWIVQS